MEIKKVPSAHIAHGNISDWAQTFTGATLGDNDYEGGNLGISILPGHA